MSTHKYIEVALEIITITDAALYVTDGDTETWLPMSTCLTDENDPVFPNTYSVGATITLNVIEWKARDCGLL